MSHVVNALPNSLRVLTLLVLLGLSGQSAWGAWQDKSTGLPIVENFSAQTLGDDSYKWIVLQDKLGRLFVGGDKLQVFDGQSWHSFPIANTHSLKALAFGDDGRLWAGAVNEAGYFLEEGLGNFKYHSLIEHLPKEEREVGVVWACATVGRNVFFFCNDKILRWDGTAFRQWVYLGKSRLFPLSLNGAPWFHHPETGLYRVTGDGPKLEVPAALLPDSGILGLGKDAAGLFLASATGLFRPGSPPVRISDEELSKYLTEARTASFTTLSDGNHVIGTVNGGLTLTTMTGETRRILDTSDGLPSRAIFSITPDSDGYVWCTTIEGIFRMEARGHATSFGPANGLKGRSIASLGVTDNQLIALTQEGGFRLVPSDSKGAHFEQLPQLTEVYNHLLPFRGGLLLARHGGMDFFDGTKVRPLFTLLAKAVFFARPNQAKPDSFYLSETGGLGLLAVQPDGSFVHTRLCELPDSCSSLLEGSRDRLLLGTVSQGAFAYDLGSQQLSPIRDPASGKPFPGRVFVLGGGQHALFFNHGRVLTGGLDGTGLRWLEDVPALDFIAGQPLPDSQGNLIVFQHANSTDAAAQEIGALAIDHSGLTHWRELDVPALHTIGFVRTLLFTRENNRPILWVGGSNGLLRLDYDSIPEMKKPDTPLIRLDPEHSTPTAKEGELAFLFQHHRVSFRVFTGDYGRSKDWLFQSRLGDGRGEWSAPSSRRSYEFTNLSAGEHRFEVRTINPHGLASEPTAFAFRILPPWYLSNWALAGYAAGLGLAIFGYIRVRERRIRARNEELETQVSIRTAELVKANAAKDEFLAGVSHEIRNPMNGVIGIAETFKLEKLDPDSRHKFSLLRQCATHLSSLLEDILDFSRVQAGAVELESREFVLSDLVQSIAAMTAAESAKRGIPVEIAISPAVPARLTGDPRRVRQILLNFVGNALKFSGRGQVSVTVWCQAAGARQTEVVFAVSDEGPGISPEEQKRLFTRFERGAAAQQGRVPGTGLGLALCKGLAEKMGGRIWLESEPGQGTCFYFSAPFALVEPAVAPAPASNLFPSGQPKTALVVDDKDYNRIVLTDLLESLGYSVRSVADGPAALDIARSLDIAVAFLDYDLPGMSGLEIARSIRALPNASAQARILATTAFTTPEKRAQCLAAGMDSFLGKPVTMERLRQALAPAAPSADAEVPAPARPAPVSDGLGNLRMIATKKGVSFAEELALYLSEFAVEFDQLQAALQQEDAANSDHYAHLLYGRCAFIAELELEQLLRKIESLGATAEWDTARALARQVESRFGQLRLKFASAAAIAPPSSTR